MYFTGWSLGPDPDYQLGINTCASLPTGTDGSGGTSQDGYCDPAFDELYAQQRSELDEQARQEIVHDMLAMNYTATPQIVFWYADGLEAYRSDRVTGFGLQPTDGGIIANQSGYWGFLTVEPVTAADEAGAGASGPGAGLVIGIIAGLVVIGGVVLIVVRRRGAADRE
jgi:peptide/nickel transport system substrate-binding protein